MNYYIHGWMILQERVQVQSRVNLLLRVQKVAGQ